MHLTTTAVMHSHEVSLSLWMLSIHPLPYHKLVQLFSWHECRSSLPLVFCRTDQTIYGNYQTHIDTLTTIFSLKKLTCYRAYFPNTSVDVGCICMVITRSACKLGALGGLSALVINIQSKHTNLLGSSGPLAKCSFGMIPLSRHSVDRSPRAFHSSESRMLFLDGGEGLSPPVHRVYTSRVYWGSL